MPLPGCCLHLIPRSAVGMPVAGHNRAGYDHDNNDEPRIYEIIPFNEYDTKSK
jgi:hypothetical protein